MAKLDRPGISAEMRKTLEARVAFREVHTNGLPRLFEAEDAYRAGGSPEAMQLAIEEACTKRPDLASEIRRLFIV